MRIPIFQVDAFTDRPFHGNPAAVCPLEAWLSDDTLQAIANENNLSETAFLVAKGEDFDLRWLTPMAEVDLCGHATLAASRVVFDHLQPKARSVRFHTRSGVLTVTRKDPLLEMDFPSQAGKACDIPDGLLAGMPGGGEPIEVLRSPHTYLAIYARADQVLAIRPEAHGLEQLDCVGVIASAPGEGSVDFVSRFFAPRVGILEDPVTGSAHCVTTPYWAAKLGKKTLRAEQVSKRTGQLTCTLAGERVILAGQAIQVMKGEFEF